MQRTATVLLTSLLAGLLMTGCPEKKVEKEEPAAREPSAVDKSGADEKADDEHGEDQADDHGEDAKDEKKPIHKKHAAKPGEEKDPKDQGGW